MSVWSIALAFFLVANPIGNIPTILSLIKDETFERQRFILFRESFLSYVIAMVFLFVGQPFLNTLHIPDYAVSVAGGTLLLIIAIRMIFPPEPQLEGKKKAAEPFLVPIATPILSGGGVMSTLLIYAQKEQNMPKILLAGVIAWTGIIGIVVSGIYLQRLLGKRGLLAMEQLMGMLLAMLSTEIIVKGLHLFVLDLQHAT